MRDIDLSAAFVNVLSAHGGLEQVILYDVRITTSAITALISNSPNLILLHIILVDYTSLNMDIISETTSCSLLVISSQVVFHLIIEATVVILFHFGILADTSCVVSFKSQLHMPV